MHVNSPLTFRKFIPHGVQRAEKRPNSIEMFKTLAEKRRATSWTDTSLLKLFSFRFHGKKPCSLERQFLHIFTFKSSGTYMSVAADKVSLAQQVGTLRFSVSVITISIVYCFYNFWLESFYRPTKWWNKMKYCPIEYFRNRILYLLLKFSLSDRAVCMWNTWMLNDQSYLLSTSSKVSLEGTVVACV